MTINPYIFIGIGGFLGTVCRMILENTDIYHTPIPFQTLIANVVGSFLLGLVLAIGSELYKISTHVKNGITIGFLGSFTTFSTFCKEVVDLIARDQSFFAILYIGLSVILGLAFVYLGILSSKIIISKLPYKKFKVQPATIVISREE